MAFRTPAHWKQRPSPNHNGRGTHRVSAILLHADAAADIAASLHWVQSAASQVSYHLMVSRSGEIFQCVAPDRRAWHAGVSVLDNAEDCNSFSVGVCLSNRNDGVEPYPITQRGAAADVCALLCAHYDIRVERIVTHAAVARPVGRKTDPKGLDVEAFRDTVRARLGAAPMGGL